MTTDGWVDALRLDDLREGRATRVAFLEDAVLVYRSGETVFAIGNRCTHQGAPLDKGLVRVAGSQRTATCPAHGSVFSLDDGSVVRGPASQPVAAYDVEVAEGLVRLRLRG